jgi:hypothetical protein
MKEHFLITTSTSLAIYLLGSFIAWDFNWVDLNNWNEIKRFGLLLSIFWIHATVYLFRKNKL